ncbi:MAG: vWA domain-containing protein [Planctomycetaceae bacterium]|nr:VWA domain-containing protein [Planctomycetaceae bacterium]
MRHAITALLTATVLMMGSVVLAAGSPKVDPKGVAAPAEKEVDIAICLDTSNSMDGLIDAAKQKLWAIVNELATAKPKPKLRVALYQYGNDGLSSENGWVQRVCDLTNDLDTVYSKLFALKTHGGTEYVARVTRAAADELKWAGKGSLKIIVVAGNEPATQDHKIPLQDACKGAAGKGIIVNTIFCGALQEGRNTGWADAAAWADGQFAAIDQNAGTVTVSTPYDKKIAELGTALNSTYIPYGKAGAAGSANQAAQDKNASSVNAPAAAQRAAAKASVVYTNSNWDLVDAKKDKQVDLAKVSPEDLPENMRKMTPQQREAYVKEQAAAREKLQKEIRELNTKRDEHVKAEMAKRGLDESKSFDGNLRKVVREQATAAGMTFEKPE